MKFYRYFAGWMLLEVCLATMLLVTVLMGGVTYLYRQSQALQQARLAALADQLLTNSLELVQLDGGLTPARWREWLAESQQRLPKLSARYVCGAAVCTVCYYQAAQVDAWRCRSAPLPVLVSLS